jgi:hypothetical protein
MGIGAFIALHPKEVQMGSIIGLAIGFVIVIVAIAWKLLGMKKEERSELIKNFTKEDDSKENTQ